MANLSTLIDSGVSRRKFIAGVGATAGAVAVLGAAGCGGSSKSTVDNTHSHRCGHSELCS